MDAIEVTPARFGEEVERLLALKGYAAAFDRTLELLPEDSGPVSITAGVILDLYVQLWLPSVEAMYPLGTAATVQVRVRTLGWNRQAEIVLPITPYELRLSVDPELPDRRGADRHRER